jgi:hypothetical protein
LSRFTRPRHVASALLCAVGCLAAVPASSGAALLGPSTACDGRPLSRPFTPWLDLATYEQAPNGGFENGLTGWTTTGGAAVVAGNEPWTVAGAGDTHALSLPAGSSATSSTVCAGLGYPTVRLFSKGGWLLRGLRVEVLYRDTSGILRSALPGVVVGSSRWQPTLPVLTLSGLPLLTGSQIAIRLTAVGAAFTVDDVYVDPYSRH